VSYALKYSKHKGFTKTGGLEGLFWNCDERKNEWMGVGNIQYSGRESGFE